MSNIHSVIDAPAPGTRGSLSFSARLRWVLVIFLLGWLLFVGILTWFFVRRSLFQQVDTVAINQLQAAAASLDDRLDRLETLAESIARALAIQWETNADNPPASAAGLLESTLASLTAEEATGLYLAAEGLPAEDPGSLTWFRRNSKSDKIQPGGPIRYDFHKESQVTAWYHKPKQTKKVFISEPYFDLGGSEERVISVTAPVITSAGRFRGIVGIDIRIEALERVRRKLQLRPPGIGERSLNETGFICSPHGNIIAHSDYRLLPSSENPEGVSIKQLPMGQEIAATPDGFLMVSLEGIPQRILWFTSLRTGWKLVFLVPETLLAEPVYVLGIQLLGVFAVGSVIIIVLISIIARKMAEPLEILRIGALADSTQSPSVHALALREDEIGLVSRWLLRLSDKASEQDLRNRFEMMRAFRLEVAHQLSELTLDVGPEAIHWDAENLANELQSRGFPIEPVQILVQKHSLAFGVNQIDIRLSEDLVQKLKVVVTKG